MELCVWQTPHLSAEQSTNWERKYILDSKTRSLPFAKANKIPIERRAIGSFRAVQPPLRNERARVGEYTLVVVNVHDRHRDGGIGRDHPVLVFQGLSADRRGSRGVTMLESRTASLVQALR